MSTDTPGWKPDPERPGTLRWWNGLGWSDARKAVADAAPSGFGVRPATDGAGGLADAIAEAVRQGAAAPGPAGITGAAGATGAIGNAARRVAGRALPARGIAGGIAGGAAGAAAGTNALAGAALLLGFLAIVLGSLVVVPLVGLVVSLLALLRSRRLARDGARRTGFGRSITGLILSVVGLVRWIPVGAELLGDLLR